MDSAGEQARAERLTVPAGSTGTCYDFIRKPFVDHPGHSVHAVATYNGITMWADIFVPAVRTSTIARPSNAVQCASLSIAPCLTATGLRAALASSDPARYYLYTPELQLMAETEQSTSTAKSIAWSYLWFGGQPVAQIDGTTNMTRLYVNDHLGTPLLQTDATGAVVWRAEYAPYGARFALRAGTSLHQPLRFPGQFVDDGNDLTNNVFRWYRAGWGRYTQADPIGLVPTLVGVKNLFEYADANPTDHFDRLGLYSIDKGCSDTCGPDNVTSCYGNPQKINCAKGLVEEVKQRVFFNAPCKKALQAAGKWAQVAGSLMPSAPFPRLTCNKADCTGSEPRYFPATRSIPMCKWFFAYSPPAGAQSMLHEFLHDAGVGDGTPEQKSILMACYPGFEP